MPDAECGYCRKSLPLYRKFFKHPFCRGAHKRAYTEKLNLLALGRLRELDAVLNAPREYSATLACEEMMKVHS